MKRILKSHLDKFYTQQDLAKRLINSIDLTKFDLVVDPCCGNGAFYCNIQSINKIGIDILPHIEGVITHDFLTWDNDINIPSNKVLVISNPPFGKQGSLAIKFIKKALTFSDTIAFILPLSFVKPSVKNKIPSDLHLVYEEILPEDSYLLDNELYSVKCVFQIWEKRNYIRESPKMLPSVGFSYTKDKSEADLSVRRVGVYAGKAFKDINKSEQSHYFLILDDKSKTELIISKLNLTKWEDYTVGPRSISKSELNDIINKIITNEL